MIEMSKPAVLLIDDEPAVAKLVAGAAESCGYDACATFEAETFRQRYSERVPDLIVLDLGMPRGDGIELLRFLADQGYGSAVVIISGFDRRILQTATALGERLGLQMEDSLAKPMRLQELRDLFSRLHPSAARAAS